MRVFVYHETCDDAHGMPHHFCDRQCGPPLAALFLSLVQNLSTCSTLFFFRQDIRQHFVAYEAANHELGNKILAHVVPDA